jgi:hypothetical protein
MIHQTWFVEFLFASHVARIATADCLLCLSMTRTSWMSKKHRNMNSNTMRGQKNEVRKQLALAVNRIQTHRRGTRKEKKRPNDAH